MLGLMVNSTRFEKQLKGMAISLSTLQALASNVSAIERALTILQKVGRLSITSLGDEILRCFYSLQENEKIQERDNTRLEDEFSKIQSALGKSKSGFRFP